MKTISAVFLTGITGVLGREVAKVLLQNDISVIALVRASSDSNFHERKRQLLTQFPVRCHVLRGDTTQENLGLSPDDRESILTSADAVIHCAGEVKLNQSKSEAIKNSVGSLNHILSLCFSLKERGRLQKLEVVSTVGVGGRSTLSLPEAPVTHLTPEFHNNYEYGKFEAEKLLFKQDLPLTVHRPSMIVGHSQTGDIADFQVFYHLAELLSGRKTLGLGPELGRRSLDIIPVDFVAKGIYLSLVNAESIGRVYNAATGPAHSLKLEPLAREIQNVFSSHGISTPPLIGIPKLQYLTQLYPIAKKLSLPIPGSAKSLYYILEYLATDQVFENDQFQQLLAQDGITIPPPRSYLSKILHRYIDETYGSEAATGEQSAVAFEREVKLIEFTRDVIWPRVRPLAKSVISKRCSICTLSEKASPLKNGLCEFCRNAEANTDNTSSAPPASALDQMIQAAIKKRSPHFDALVLFSGGKDSTLMIDRLQSEYPDLRLLALTVDNTFMSPVALKNIASTIQRLKVDHQIIRPSRRTMRKMYAHAFKYRGQQGCSQTVDQFDGDFFHDVARNVAHDLHVPLIFSGLSTDQVERILHLDTFHTDKQNEQTRRTHVAGFKLTDIFDDDEMKWWWHGQTEDPPLVAFPFYVWRMNEEDIKAIVVKKGFITGGNQSPLLTNSRLVPLMAVADFACIGYSSFEPEFARNVRRGTSDAEVWRNTFEIAEFSARTGFMLNASIGKILLELGLTREDVGLNTKTRE